MSIVHLQFLKNFGGFSSFIKRFFQHQLFWENHTLFCYFANWKASRLFSGLIERKWNFALPGFAIAACCCSMLTELRRYDSKTILVHPIWNKVCTYEVIYVFGWLKYYISLALLIIVPNFHRIRSRKVGHLNALILVTCSSLINWNHGDTGTAAPVKCFAIGTS